MTNAAFAPRKCGIYMIENGMVTLEIAIIKCLMRNYIVILCSILGIVSIPNLGMLRSQLGKALFPTWERGIPNLGMSLFCVV